MIKKHPIRAISLIFFIIFCTFSTIIYLSIGSGGTKSMIEQMLHREQIIARSGAKSISTFIDLNSKALLTLADQENVTDQELKEFINNFSGTPITGAVKTDANGKVVSTHSNVENLTSGADISNRDFFQSAKNDPSQKLIISKPFISTIEGANQNYKVSITTPIVKQGQFQGILSISISIPILTDNFLNSLKISDQTDIILLDKDGYFLSSNYPQVVGRSIKEYVEKNPFLGDKLIVSMIQEKLQETDEQKIDIVIPNLSTGKLTRTLIASSPVNFENNKWILVITTPVQDALVFVSPFILKNILGIFISFFISISISLYLFNRFIKN